jgi:hypothetical protein
MPDEPWVRPPDPVYGDPFNPGNDPSFWESFGPTTRSDPLLSYEDIQRMYLFGLENEGGMSEEFGRRVDELIKSREKKVTLPPPFWIGMEELSGKAAQPEGELLPPAVVEPPMAPREPSMAQEIDEGAFPDEVAQAPVPLTKKEKKEKKRADFAEMFGRGLDAAVRKITPPPKPTKGPPTGVASGNDFTIVDRNRSIYRTYLKIAQRKYGPEMADMAAQMRTLNYDQGTSENPDPYQLRDIQAMFATGKQSLRAAHSAATGAKRKEDVDLVTDLTVATEKALESVHLISSLEVQAHPGVDELSAGRFGEADVLTLLNKIKQARLEEYYQAWLDPDKEEGAKAVPEGREKIGGKVRLHYFDLRSKAEEKGIKIQPINDIILGAQRGAR